MTHEEAVPRLPELLELRRATGEDPLAEHVAGCASCRARLRTLRAIDARLRDLDGAPTPSADLERRVLAIPREPVAAPVPPRRRRRVVAASAAALCALALIAGALAMLQRDADGGPRPDPVRTVALEAPGGSAAEARVEIGPREGELVVVRVVATGLPHGGGRFYGLWLTGPAGAVSGGSFRPDDEGRCVVVLRVPGGPWSAADITAGDRPPSPSTTVAHAAL